MNNLENIPSFVRRSRLNHQYHRDLLKNELKNFSVNNASLKSVLEINHRSRIALEVGFGDGYHIFQKALLQPETLFIGCEVYLNGIAKLLKNITDHKINNILIYNGDARELCKILPNGVLHEIYILFPDPWPKTKHHKRRLINNDFLNIIHDKRNKDSRLVIATDHSDYAKWISKSLNDSGVNYTEAKPVDWIQTKYQRKSEKLQAQSHYFISVIVSK